MVYTSICRCGAPIWVSGDRLSAADMTCGSCPPLPPIIPFVIRLARRRRPIPVDLHQVGDDDPERS
jgi:hypothetical protein